MNTFTVNSSDKNTQLHKGITLVPTDGSGLRIVILYTNWNATIIQSMLTSTVTTLTKNGVDEANIITYMVPGAYELPFAAKSFILKDKSINAVICLGCVIKGATLHMEYICDSVTHGLSQVGLETGIPVIFGVLTVLTEDQALERAGLKPGSHNHGEDYAIAAIQMSKLAFRDATKL